ncbi:hypothetical protein AVEN_193036-1, partial [Araneus ventricosus]
SYVLLPLHRMNVGVLSELNLNQPILDSISVEKVLWTDESIFEVSAMETLSERLLGEGMRQTTHSVTIPWF